MPTFPVIFRHHVSQDDDDDVDSPHLNSTERESEESLPVIFTKDPAEWMRFVDQRVRIVLDDGVVKSGVIHVIDPVSEAVVLVDDQLGGDDVSRIDSKIKMEIIPGHVVKEISILSKAEPHLLKTLSTIFDEDSSSSTSSSKPLSDEELAVKREEVKEWLMANRIPVQIGGIKGDVIEVAGKALIIKAPYGVDHCFSLNEIILKKVQQLLRNKEGS